MNRKSKKWHYVYGKNPVKAYLERIDNNNSSSARLFLSERNKYYDIYKKAIEKNVGVTFCTDEDIEKLSGIKEHRGLLLRVSSQRREGVRSLMPFKEKSLVVVLDHIEDPHNIGAIVRTCDKFEVSAVVVPSRRAATDSPIISKVSSGADAYVPLVIENNISRTIDLLKDDGFWVYGADMSGEPAPSVSFPSKVCLVMGNEGSGLSRLVRDKCDQLVSIPSGGNVDSFNVSVATGILLYEIVRQSGNFFSL